MPTNYDQIISPEYIYADKYEYQLLYEHPQCQEKIIDCQDP